MTLHLIRHGTTAANEKRLYCGSTDIPLSEAGRQSLLEQKKSGAYPPADIYISGGLLRCVQTAEILYDNPPLVKIPELNEISFGDFEMRGHPELETLPEYRSWIADIENAAPPNGESKPVFVERVAAGFLKARSLCGTAGSAVIVTHGGVIAAIMERLFPGEKSRYDWTPRCGGGYTVYCGEERGEHYIGI